MRWAQSRLCDWAPAKHGRRRLSVIGIPPHNILAKIGSRGPVLAALSVASELLLADLLIHIRDDLGKSVGLNLGLSP